MAGKVIRVAADTLPEPDVVDLFDHKFVVRRITRSVQKSLEAVDKKLNSNKDEDDADKIVALMSEGLDALLAGEGHEKTAKQILVEAWKKDVLSLDQINSLYLSVQESGAARPT